MKESANSEIAFKKKRTFYPADEWLYLKIYCGYSISEQVITKIIYPLVTELTVNDLIKKWFFLRYSDPELHIRSRFLLNQKDDFYVVLECFRNKLDKWLKNKCVWRMQIDTYRREIERYEFLGIDFAESFFNIDSKYVVEMMVFLFNQPDEHLRWQFAFKSIHSILLDFGLTEKEIVEFYYTQKEAYAKEFGVNRELKQKLGKRYRKYYEKITILYDSTPNPDIDCLDDILTNRSNELQTIIYDKEIQPGLSDNKTQYLASLIHMHINRLFRSNQRQNEFVLYDFLYRYFYSEFLKKANSTPNK